MPAAHEVTPRKWTNLKVLYDADGYSVVSGTFENDNGDRKHALGERWNGGDGHPGFPNQGGNPIWHVVPDFLARPILHALLDETLRSKAPERKERAQAILDELAAQGAA